MVLHEKLDVTEMRILKWMMEKTSRDRMNIKYSRRLPHSIPEEVAEYRTGIVTIREIGGVVEAS